MLKKFKTSVLSLILLLTLLVIAPQHITHAGTTPTWAQNWQFQYTTPFDSSIVADHYVIDGFDNPTSTVTTIHSLNGHTAKAVCYIDTGTWESWRSDAEQFPSSILGNYLSGSTTERYLDIRQLSLLGALMDSRFNMCKTKGFDVVFFDNIDSYLSTTGYSLTSTNEVSYIRTLANYVHSLGMQVVLNNDLELSASLIPYEDFQVTEQCAQYKACSQTAPYVAAGKIVIDIEYTIKPPTLCNVTNPLKINGLFKYTSMDPYRYTCYVY